MKRFFRNLKTLALVAMVGVATLATSCNQDELDQIKADLSDLTERVDALEQKLDTEIAALQALIGDAKADHVAAVVACEKDADGNWVVTLANGTVLNLSCATNSALTVVEIEGAYYWAQVVDGEAVAMVDADGNNIAVAAGAQVRQDADGRTEVSLDGGQTWVAVAGEVALFTNVVVENNAVTFTLAGGKSFTVALPEQFSFNVWGNAAYFKAGETKTFSVEGKGISDATVVTIPQGWKAVLADNELIVTAPSEEEVEAGVAVAKGAVKVLAVSAENHAVLGNLTTTLGNGIEILLEERTYSYINYETWEEITETGLCVVIRDYDYLGVDRWDNPAWTPIEFGIMPKGAMTPENIVDMIENYNYEYGYYATGFSGSWPDSVVGDNGEVAETVKSVAQLVGECFPSDPVTWEDATPVVGQQYQIWAAFNGNGEKALDAKEIVMVDYTHAGFELEQVGESTAVDVQIAVGIAGYDGYSLFLSEAGKWEAEFEWWQESQTGYYPQPYFGWLGTETRFEGSLFEFGADPDADEPMVVLPNTEYELAILVLDNDKGVMDYTKEDVKVYKFTTGVAGTGSSVKPTFTVDDIDYSSVSVNINVENAAVTMYKFFAEDPTGITPEELAATEEVYMSTDNYMYANTWGLNAGTTVYLVAVSLDKDGNYGDVVIESYTTKTVEFTDAMTVTIGEITCNDMGNTVYVPVTATGDVVEYYYLYANDGGYRWTEEYGGTKEGAESYMSSPANYWSYTQPVGEEGSALTLEIKYGPDQPTPNTLGHILVMAKDAEGNFSHAAYATFTPTGGLTLIYEDEEGWEFGKPTVAYKGLIDGVDWVGDTQKEVAFDITFTEGTSEVYVWITSSDYLTSYTPYSMIEAMATPDTIGGLVTLTESGVASRYYTYCRDYRDPNWPEMNSDAMVVIGWKDTNNKYHQAWYNREAAEAAQDDIAAQYELENSGDSNEPGIMK